MPSDLLYRRNLLGYPAGTRAGFNPTHPAAQGITNRHGISLIAGSGGLVNLVTGSAGTNTAGFVNGTFTRLGPNLRLPSSTGSSYSFSGPNPPIADTVGTIAAIYTVDSAADAGNIFSTDSTGVLGMALRNTQFVMPGIIAVSHGLTMLANTPMFLAASKGPAFINFVMVDLLTGKTVSAAVANANTPGAPNGATQGVGGQAGAGCIIGNVAAAMWAPTYLSMSQLLAWAADPWAFWYPPPKTFRVAGVVSAAPTDYFPPNKQILTFGSLFGR